MEHCSVVVLSYNSQETINETLNSILEQGKRNVEVIISDDASQDNSISLIKDWVSKNALMFDYRPKLIASDENLGIAGNLKEGVSHASCEWVKVLAGDDLLASNALETYMSFIRNEPQKHHVIFANVQEFFGNIHSLGKVFPESIDKKKFNLDAREQFEALKFHCFPAAPSCFFNKKIIHDFGAFSSDYGIEDYPTWLSLTKQGVTLGYIDEVLVYYRRDFGSITVGDKLISKFLLAQKKSVYRNIISPENSNFVVKAHHRICFFVDDLIVFLGNKKNLSFLMYLKNLSPFILMRKVSKVVNNV
ncbi:glycosyltransferase [Vibrio splendidus]|uniref:glycosyltransferase n=1 Tax=Vibrio splendidus TaxID=29497 RepID=UPI000E32C70F|nr:glycosyltransferase [Vibrio splendidus]